eukprot:15343718-Ditylum_brightwellii.AAC.1
MALPIVLALSPVPSIMDAAMHHMHHIHTQWKAPVTWHQHPSLCTLQTSAHKLSLTFTLTFTLTSAPTSYPTSAPTAVPKLALTV